MNDLRTTPLSLAGRTALVTGGGRGIGRAVSMALATAGAYVAVNYRTGEEEAQAGVEAIISGGGQAKSVRFDVGDSGEVNEAVTQLVSERGTIDILVSNAGISVDGLVGRMKDEDWEDVIRTNLTGSFFLIRSVARTMIRRRWGRIVTMSSTAGEAGNAGQANYSAAKAGLIGLTRALARELAPRNITVNAVSPGLIEGGMSGRLTDEQLDAIRTHVPMGRLGKPEDVAAAVLFLCSGMADYVTGQVVRVNGGLYM